MKTLSLALLSAAALALGAVSAIDTPEDTRQLFHVHTERALFESFYSGNKADLDLWSATTNADGTIDAELVGAPSVMRQLELTVSDGRSLRAANSSVRVLAAEADNAAGAANEKAEVAACHAQSNGYISSVGANGAPFTASKFHDCWRTSTQVFEFLDKLTAIAPHILTKISSIGKTFEGRDIPAYKISTGASSSKQALMGQSLIHAREWQSGGSVFYIISGMLDALLAGDSRTKAIFDQYDWYFVPILNVDGYEFSWTTGNRLWRRNRRTFTANGRFYVGVDLNRNFGPQEFFDLEQDSLNPGTDIYPGTAVLSEPEAAAVWNFLVKLPNKLAGVLDVHMNSQAVLRPFSNQVTEAPEPYKTKLTDLGGKVQTTIQTGSSLQYRNIMGGTGSYLAYGTFKDAVYMEFDHVPGYTLELERRDGGFISSQTTIRDVGKRTLSAFLAFSEGVTEYWRSNTSA